MSVMRMWVICDRCGFRYRRNQTKMESTGVLVCAKCDDGAYDRIKHPQNKSARPQREPTNVPNGTPDDNLTTYLLTESGFFVLTESQQKIIIPPTPWNIRQTTFVFPLFNNRILSESGGGILLEDGNGFILKEA